MSAKQTQKSRWPSPYSPNKFVSSAQYITEKLCEKIAKAKGTDLPIQFWHLPEWEKFYKSQIWSANRLLAQYSDKAILAAINNKKCNRLTSLRAKYFISIVQEEQTKINRAPVREIETEREKIEGLETFRPDNARKNILSTLDEIDEQGSSNK